MSQIDTAWQIRTFVQEIRTFVQMVIDMIRTFVQSDGMKITNIEIAKCAWCSEGAVRKAVDRGLNISSLDAVFDFIFRMRVKEIGVGVLEDKPEKPLAAGKFPRMVTGGNVGKVVEELHYVPEESQEEVFDEG